jgi:hypothetical protein
MLYGTSVSPSCQVYHASSVVWHPMLTFSPPQPASAIDVAPHDTRDHVATSSMPHTKPVAHALTQKTYIANQNKMCSKPSQKDTPDSIVSSTPEPFHDDLTSLPTFHFLIAQINSTLS